MRRACVITLTEDDKATLERWSRTRSTEARLVERARIVLLAAAGRENKDIAVELGITRATVGRWRNRFAERGIPGIGKDAPRGGRPPKTRDQLVRKIVEMTTQQKPANATHWSTRTLAKALGTNASMVSRVWRANGLKPHLVRTFKVSNDPKFVEKLVDVVGLYLDPPEHALVLCVDEKSQIQALDRTQKSLPIYPGRCETMTHDYKRNGTTTLFAALNVVEGKLIGQCMPRHRHQEFIKFLKQIDAETPPDLDLHLIVDNYATHKHPRVKAWLKRHKRFHLHFYSYKQFVAQPGRTLVPRDHHQAHPSWSIYERRAVDRGDSSVYRRSEQRSKTVCLDSQSGGHPRESRPCTGCSG